MPFAPNHSFEHQWAHPKKILVGKTTLEVHDVAPLDEKGIPVLFVLGWAGVPSVCKDHAEGIFDAGRRVISVNAPHGITHQLVAKEITGPIANAELRRIAAFMGTLAALGIEKVDAIGNSEAAIDLIVAAAMYPEKFSSLILIDPVGFTKMSLAHLLIGYAKDLGKALRIAHRVGRLKKFLTTLRLMNTSVVLHPLHSVAEVFAIARSDVSHLVPDVKARGIRIHVILSQNDLLRRKQTEQKIKSLADTIAVVEGGHLDVLLYPERYVKVALGTLQASAPQ
jgi:pimeloyl-ACP methyl ester carboxylesterase